MCIQNLKSVDLTVPEKGWDNRTQKIWAVLRFAHAPSSPKFLMGFSSDGSVRNRAGRFFALPNFWGRAFQNCTQFITPASRPVDWKSFVRIYSQYNPEIIEHNTLNFRPNFKFSRLKFFGGGGTPVPLGVCASKAWSISIARVKISGAAPPKGRNIVSQRSAF